MLQSSKMFHPKTLHEMIMPLLVANFVLGIGIWTTKRGRILNIAYSFVCLVIYCVLMKFSMEYMYLYFAHKANDFGVVIFRAIFYANICFTLFLVPSGWLRRKRMKEAMMRITMCEKTMELMGLPKNYRKLYLNQLYALGFIVLIFIVSVIINYNGMFVENTPLHSKIVLILAVNYPVALLYVTDVSFLHWVRYAKMRFEQLNSLLQRMLTTTPDSPQHKRVLKMKDEWNKTFTSPTQQDRRSEENTETMRACKQVHLELIKATRSTNEAYGIQILCSMTISFVFITSLLYYAYSIFWLPLSKEVFRQEMIEVVSWILFYASKVLIINHMCALASIEAANTGDIICELYEPSTSKEFRAEIRDFTLQLIQNPLIFTACGFFNLDHTFIHGVIGSVTTYLVILIQVGDLPQSNSTKNSSILNNGTSLTTFSSLTTYVYDQI
ncbi:putative gustatory receptor 28b [Formica exsecta]|uniref:putative gustatory receptor 28b n=1 Tax=Formica exsecta TaxID=72781 RepID=UPI001143A717|nr:putative gustatory receptor 28b [Formica exsecta]